MKDNISGQRYLFVLFVDSDEDPNNPEQPTYSDSILIRLKVDENDNISYDDQVNVGMNAVEIIPVSRVPTPSGDSKADGTDDNYDNGTFLLISAMGGPQKGGAANGEDSTISRIPAFGDWSTGAEIAIFGDATGDFRAIAATDRVNGAGVVYILIGYFNSDHYNGFNWKLYKSTVNKMITATNLTLTQAASGTDPVLEQVDGDNTISPDAADPYGIYFWDILYETSEDAASNVKDRLHFFKGSALQVTPAAAYPDPATQAIQPPSDDPAPIEGNGYVLFPLGVRDGRMGGYNVDSADLTAETLRQYKSGVSLKRGARATHIAK
jgi:hypothetical protein